MRSTRSVWAHLASLRNIEEGRLIPTIQRSTPEVRNDAVSAVCQLPADAVNADDSAPVGARVKTEKRSPRYMQWI